MILLVILFVCLPYHGYGNMLGTSFSEIHSTLPFVFCRLFLSFSFFLFLSFFLLSFFFFFINIMPSCSNLFGHFYLILWNTLSLGSDEVLISFDLVLERDALRQIFAFEKFLQNIILSVWALLDFILIDTWMNNFRCVIIFMWWIWRMAILLLWPSSLILLWVWILSGNTSFNSLFNHYSGFCSLWFFFSFEVKQISNLYHSNSIWSFLSLYMICVFDFIGNVFLPFHHLEHCNHNYPYLCYFTISLLRCNESSISR